jgi:hypothetical protein
LAGQKRRRQIRTKRDLQARRSQSRPPTPPPAPPPQELLREINARSQARAAELAAAADHVTAAARQGRTARRFAGLAVLSERRPDFLAARGTLRAALLDAAAAAAAAVDSAAACVPPGAGGGPDAAGLRFDPAGAQEVHARGAGLGRIRSAPPPPHRHPPPQQQLMQGQPDLWATGTWPTGPDGLAGACEAALFHAQHQGPPPQQPAFPGGWQLGPPGPGGPPRYAHHPHPPPPPPPGGGQIAMVQQRVVMQAGPPPPPPPPHGVGYVQQEGQIWLVQQQPQPQPQPHW